MAIVLRMTDGSTTVNLNDPSRLRALRGIEIGSEDQDIDVNEAWSLRWAVDVSMTDKASDVQDLNQLLAKASLHFDKGRINRAVWIEMRPEGAPNTQYCKVKGGRLGSIQNRFLNNEAGSEIDLAFVREGAWRSVAPDGTAGASEVSSETRYNKSDGDGDNWVDISSRDNDLLSKLVIKLTNNAAWDNLIIAMKRDTSVANLNRFQPHFNPDDQSTSHTPTSDSEAPGDDRIDLTASDTISWKIQDTDLPYYTGTYAVYCKAYSTAGSWQARYKDDLITGEYKDVGSAAASNLIHLGDFPIPAVELNPFVTIGTSNDLQVNVEFNEVSAGTVRFYGMWFIPLDVPVYHIRCLANTIIPTRRMVHDGVNEISYQIETVGGNAAYDRPLAPGGRYQQSLGGEINRLFFYAWEGSDFQHNDTFTIDVEVVDTFATIRGAA